MKNPADFDWNRARAFLATAQSGSFSAAAVKLGLTQPTVGRQVAALEQELGVALFERVGRGLSLTDAGAELVEPLESMADAARRVSLSAAGHSTGLEGVVAITASEVLAAHYLPPAVARIRREHPGIEVEIVADNAVRDLRRREADIAVRNARPEDPDLVARKLAQADGYLYATPGYLEQLGPLERLEDLQRAHFFAFDRSDLMIKGFAAQGLTLTPANFPVVVASHLVQWQLARAGLGICAMMQGVGDPDPAVVRVADDRITFPVPVWLVAHRELRTSKRIRVAYEILAEELKAAC